jgi:hypothetical protein
LKRDKSGVVEPLIFAAATLVYIWTLRQSAPWTICLLVLWSGVILVRLGGSTDEIGLSPQRFSEALVAWRGGFLAGLVALCLVLQQRLTEPETLFQGSLYFVWCCIQQLVYQNVIYRRARTSLGAGRPAWIFCGLVFGIVHLPNPVLVPATTVWGTISSYLFERRPSIPALALAQVALSSLLYEVTPMAWRHGFRVGPAYFGVSLFTGAS